MILVTKWLVDTGLNKSISGKGSRRILAHKNIKTSPITGTHVYTFFIYVIRFLQNCSFKEKTQTTVSIQNKQRLSCLYPDASTAAGK